MKFFRKIRSAFPVTVSSNERGFSYAEVMMSVGILATGAIALGAALTAGLVVTRVSEQQLRAKQMCSSTIESILTARDIAMVNNTLNYGSIRNVAAGGIFLDGSQSVYDAEGADGIIGTADDATGNNVIVGYTRTIVFTDVADPNRPSPPNPITMRKVVVTISYSDRGQTRTESMTSYIADLS
jgi:Tfp pilus assembly protein PilV